MRLLYLITTISLAFILAGCPVSSKFPLGKSHEYKIDKRLLGNWTCSSEDVEVNKISFMQKDEYTYTVKVDERGGMYASDTDDFNGWITKLEGKEFLVLQEIINGEPVEQYFVYSLTKIENDQIQTNDISLKVNGTEAIISIEAYRAEVKASMNLEGFLANDLFWSKSN